MCRDVVFTTGIADGDQGLRSIISSPRARRIWRAGSPTFRKRSSGSTALAPSFGKRLTSIKAAGTKAPSRAFFQRSRSAGARLAGYEDTYEIERASGEGTAAVSPLLLTMRDDLARHARQAALQPSHGRAN